MDYDLVIIGGGLAGASLGIAMARHGASVLILEKDAVFRDRVRGEAMLPWGAAEAEALGIRAPLLAGCARNVPYWIAGGEARDLPATSPSGLGCLNFHHPDMQEQLLDLAAEAGCDIRRPSEAIGVLPGCEVTVIARNPDGEFRCTARLVVGADGRASRVRAMAGMTVRRDPDCLVIAGALFHGIDRPDDATVVTRRPGVAETALLVPLGADRYRAYFIFRDDAMPRLSGQRDEAAFVAACTRTGAASEWFDSAELRGPIASFSGADQWVDHPYRNGIVLIGDAAATSDPTFGCGLSLTMRDVRVLRDQLLAQPDWQIAAGGYAVEHDKYFQAIHLIEQWRRDLFYSVGPEAEALRSRAVPKLMEDLTRTPDFIGLGPEAPHDEAARRRFFGLD
jgi:menaquinone-9 beta-reductase